MPTLHIQGHDPVDVLTGKRLAQAITDAGIAIGHRCGGHARCTTCRVRITEGEPTRMTVAEREKLKAQNLLGEVRLSCQILVEGDLSVEVLMTQEAMGWSDPGPDLEPTLTPDPEWVTPSAD